MIILGYARRKIVRTAVTEHREANTERRANLYSKEEEPQVTDAFQARATDSRLKVRWMEF